jgi:hypothetical protein
MKRLPVKVECYAGNRADERPRRIRVEGRDYIIARLLSSSIEQSLNAKAPVRRFRVATEDNWQLDLTCTADGEWFLEGEPRHLIII